MHNGLRDEPDGGGGGLPAEQRGEQVALALGRYGRVAERAAQLRVGGEDAAEAEQLVLDVVEAAVRLGLGGRGHHADTLKGVRQVSRPWTTSP